ncbi:MAG: PilZ domain-containing protein [Phycisphaerae bacterium]|nr:PilZ domain-containing protein [Phycisphaerae bacterium]
MIAKTAERTAERPPEDRRRSKRTPNVGKAFIASPTATNPEDRLEATAVDISRHGVRFALPSAIPESAFYVIELTMGTQKIKAEIQVISCLRNGDHYEVGAEFC